MRITLVQTGGLLPVTKEASKEVNWSDDELEQLLSAIERKNSADSPARDAISFLLDANGKESEIDLTKVPAAYRQLFASLESDLKIIKT